MHKVINGDSLNVLKTLESNSVDSCVTDPPYELGFMGKKWDSTGIAYNVALWQEVYRVLKPGAHLLAFGGTRTYHRMACAIEDAGFEIRDQMQWLYASGFPKSHDISKAIDKQAGAEREVIGAESLKNRSTKKVEDASNIFLPREWSITAPATPAAIQWQGWGTALKPANEPICVARKPFNCTVAENVLQWGTGAINVDAGRVPLTQYDREEYIPNRCGWKNGINHEYIGKPSDNVSFTSGKNGRVFNEKSDSLGRWPANIILDEEAAKMLDEQSGELSGCGCNPERTYKRESIGIPFSKTSPFLTNKNAHSNNGGGASRFFYVAKASKSEREAGLEGFELGEPPASARSKPAEGRKNALGEPRANHHPTVKPIKLMEYLVKLVTPPNGIVLDPFTGSGTTGCACARLGFGFIGIEKESKYKDIAEARINYFACELA
jgi:site-specific DNA-methyltransferase (adenine-specific)